MQPFLFFSRLTTWISQTFSVTSEHIRFFTFLVFRFYTFYLSFPCGRLSCHVGFRAHVKIASRIVSYRFGGTPSGIRGTVNNSNSVLLRTFDGEGDAMVDWRRDVVIRRAFVDAGTASRHVHQIQTLTHRRSYIHAVTDNTSALNTTNRCQPIITHTHNRLTAFGPGPPG